MSKSLLQRLTASVLLAAFVNCASAVNGRFERIEAVATPAGTDVSVICAGSPVDSGVTPTRVRIPRSANGCEMRFAHDGYEAATVPLARNVSGLYWANLGAAFAIFPAAGTAASGGIGAGAVAAVLGAVSVFGASGLIIDRLTGAMYSHEPNRVEVQLRRK